MKEADVAAWLNNLTDKRFVEFFYKSLADRFIFHGDEAHTETHLLLGHAYRQLEDDGRWGDWETQLLCPVPNERWVDDAPICQHGSHCGHSTVSWAKNSVCPICGGPVYGT